MLKDRCEEVNVIGWREIIVPENGLCVSWLCVMILRVEVKEEKEKKSCALQMTFRSKINC